MLRSLELWYNGVVRPFRGMFTSPRISRDAQSYVKKMDRDGVVLLPKFLPCDAFSAIRREYEALLNVAVFEPAVRPGLKCQARLHEASTYLKIDGGGALERLAREHFLNSQLLNEITAGVLRRRIEGINPDMRTTAFKNVNPTCQDVSRGNEFHYDTPASCVMMFYYLHDIDETNGAFIYAKGSHRLSVARFWWVYRQIALRTWNRLIHRDSFGFTLVSQEDAQFLKLRPTPMIGKGNTLVIWDKKGFHKRGNLEDGQLRKMLEISYGDVVPRER